MKKTAHNPLKRSHYDSKGSISLQFQHGFDHSQAYQQSIHDDEITIHSSEQGIPAQEFTANSLGYDDTDFSDTKIAMAKAYDDDEPETTHFASAKAYDADAVEVLPADTTNEYSDVFEMDDEELFDDVQTVTKQAEMLSFDEVDQDDQFAEDLKAVLAGKKSLANLTDYVEPKEKATQQAVDKPIDPASETAVEEMQAKMEERGAIFEQFAADRNRLTTYQLGDIELESMFSQANADLDKKPIKKTPLTEEEVREIVDNNTTVAMSGLDLAEDFEYMDSIAEKPIIETPQNESEMFSEAVVEEEVTVKPEEQEIV